MNYQIKNITSEIIRQIYNQGTENKAVLAALRTSSSIDSHQATPIWPLLFAALKLDDLSKNGRPTPAEIAVFTALKCYAFFQQASDSFVYSEVKDKGLEFFQVLAKMRQNEQLKEALDRRVSTLLAGTNVASTINDIIHLVKILKGQKENYRIDFGQLAQDLYYFQLGNESARHVCLRWGQEYYWVSENVKGEEK